MTRDSDTSVIATRVRRCLIITLPADLLPEVIDAARNVTLEGLQGGGAQVVVFELSAVQVMDREDFESLQAVAAMAQLLGARPLWVGLRAGIVMHLVESDIDTSEVEAVRDLEEALARADAQQAAQDDADEDEADDGTEAWSGDGSPLERAAA
jgi:anti-anti-sigma regulatory factor